MLNRSCDRKHKTRVSCSRRKEGCHECVREDKEHERRIRRDIKLEEDRARRQEHYQRRLQEVDDRIEHQRRVMKYQAEEEEQENTLKARGEQLEALEKSRKNMEVQKKQQAESKLRAAKRAQEQQLKGTSKKQRRDIDGGTDPNSAKAEWEHLKEEEGAFSSPMDELMAMIGLEEVKQEFLSIKSKVDTAIRQGISLSKERFGCCMLGNPGTGLFPREVFSLHCCTLLTYEKGKPPWPGYMLNS